MKEITRNKLHQSFIDLQSDFIGEIESSIAIGFIQLPNGKKAQVQIMFTSDRDDWIGQDEEE